MRTGGKRTIGWRIWGLVVVTGEKEGRAGPGGSGGCALFFPFSVVSSDSFPFFTKTAGMLNLANERASAP